MDDFKRNGSGYIDPTAYKAIKHSLKPRQRLAYKVIYSLYNVSHLAGFEILDITIKDTKTGEIFKDRL